MSVQSHAHAVLSPREQAGARVSDLFEQHGRMVFAICRLVLRDHEEAEDAAQQTFLSAHGSLLGGTEPQDPAAWLATIARNECRHRRRAPDTVVVPLDDDRAALDGDPQRALAQSEEIELLCQALTELPASQRQAVVLREFYGLSYSEIAAVLDASGPAVESLLFKARRRLQERLRPLRRASGILFLPDGVRDALAATIPGFASGTGAAATGSLAAKAVALPLATKVAAAVLAIGVGGGIAVSSGSLHAPGGVGSKPHVATTPSARPAAEGIRAASTLAPSDIGGSDASGALQTAQERGDAADQVESPEQPEPREAPEPTQVPETSEPAEAPETSEPAERAESVEAD